MMVVGRIAFYGGSNMRGGRDTVRVFRILRRTYVFRIRVTFSAQPVRIFRQHDDTGSLVVAETVGDVWFRRLGIAIVLSFV